MNNDQLFTEVMELKGALRILRYRNALLYGLTLILACLHIANYLLPGRVLAQSGRDLQVDTLQARRVEIVDSNGKVRRVSLLEDGGVYDGFYDRSGRRRIIVGVDPADRAMVSLTVTEGADQGRVGLLAGPSTGAGAIAESPRGTWAVGANPTHGVMEVMRGADRNVRHAAYVDAEGVFRFYVEKSAFERATDVLSLISDLNFIFGRGK